MSSRLCIAHLTLANGKWQMAVWLGGVGVQDWGLTCQKLMRGTTTVDPFRGSAQLRDWPKIGCLLVILCPSDCGLNLPSAQANIKALQ